MAFVKILSLLCVLVLTVYVRGQLWSKLPDGPDPVLQVEAFDQNPNPKLYSVFIVTTKNELLGFNETSQSWFRILEGVKNIGGAYDDSFWIVLLDGSVLRGLFSKFGTPAFAPPPVDKKLVQVAPLSFEKVLAIDSADEIFFLDTSLPAPEWKKWDGAATWIAVDQNGVAWAVNSKASNPTETIFVRESNKWVVKPGGAVTVHAQRSTETDPLVVITSPIQEIFMYSGSVYKPDVVGRPWTKLKGLLAQQCSVSDTNLFCVAKNGTVFKSPVSAFANTQFPLPQQQNVPASFLPLLP